MIHGYCTINETYYIVTRSQVDLQVLSLFASRLGLVSLINLFVQIHRIMGYSLARRNLPQLGEYWTL
jgi:hypothetical protein